ncbi:MAG: hypothetical protein IID45_04560 [Planctomycetes bacterium]|nr:hypothetical protein [Planctomycetota bacterium]
MPVTPTGSTLDKLTEHILDWRTNDVVVEEETRIVRNIALTGLHSKNGYVYSEQALRDAIPLYDGKPVFLDHARSSARPYDRSTRDLVGSIVNPRFEHGRVRSDIQVLETESGRTFLALAAAKNSAVGMSHVVLAERSADRTTVEKIHDVISIDAVVFPATTTNLREQSNGDESTTLSGSMESIQERIESRLSDLVRRLAKDPTASIRRIGLFPRNILIEISPAESGEPQFRLLDWSLNDSGELFLGESLTEVDTEWTLDENWSAAITELQNSIPDNGNRNHEELLAEIVQLNAKRDSVESANKTLRERLTQYNERERQQDVAREIERLISESALARFAVTELLMQQLLDAPDEKARRALIAERVSLMKAIRVQEPDSRERIHSEATPFDEGAFITAVRTRRFSGLRRFG